MSKVIEESIITTGDLIYTVNKKIRVLEITEEAEIQDNADSKKKFFTPLFF
jgi:hypothetical protein